MKILLQSQKKKKRIVLKNSYASYNFFSFLFFLFLILGWNIICICYSYHALLHWISSLSQGWPEWSCRHKTAHFIQISAVNLNWLTAGSVSDLRASPDTALLIWDCLWRCRRLCSIMSWVATSSSKIPLDVSKSMTLSWWMLIMRQISWEPGTENTCDLHADYLQPMWLKL